jgi:Zn-dependent M28 family amino/carboxypeptidase
VSSPTLAERLRRHVETLAVEIGERNVFVPDALHAAEAYIRRIWEQQGYAVDTQEYQVRDVRSANLEITRAGRRDPSKVLLIGAHYDSVAGCPGANDNGSGVASLLELSRSFIDSEPEISVRFVAFVNEEPPFFFTPRQGSMVYSKAARKRGDDIRLMVALETMACYSDEPGSQRYPPLFRYFFPSRANFIAMVSNLRSRRLLRRLARAFREGSDFPLEYAAVPSWITGVGWSDHLSFWVRGYRAAMVTDTAFFRYPYYHTPMDTAEKLDYGRLAEVTEGLRAAFEALAVSDI